MIRINDDFKFTVDERCMTLYHRTIIKDTKKTKAENIGKDKWSVVGYYTSVEHMLHRIIENVGLVGCKSLQDIAERQEKLKKDLLVWLKKCDSALLQDREQGLMTFQGVWIKDLK